MSAITLNVPDDLAERLRSHVDRLPEILEFGLRELNAEALGGFQGAAEILEILARLPSPEEIVKLRPSDRLARRVKDLLEKSRSGTLDVREQEEWANYEFLEHLVRIAKARAHSMLEPTPVIDA
jgi:hypothetical protein